MNEFIPIYFPDKIKIVNPHGFIGIVTLWSQIEWVMEKMQNMGIDLSLKTSPIAAAGNLYGNGLPELLRNLLYNPRITRIIICGNDRSGSGDELMKFFRDGLEEVDFLGDRRFRIKGTNRLIDDMVTPDMFVNKPEIYPAGDLKTPESIKKLTEYIQKDNKINEVKIERIKIPLPQIHINRFPSNPRNHNITADNPLKAWIDLIFRIYRFGYLTHLQKGDRQELQNIKVVVEKPDFIEPEKLTEFGFNPDEFREYYDHFLDSELPPDTTYTYGNRLGEYFGKNTIDECIKNLKKDPRDRKSYISLWDSSGDISRLHGHPCLVTIFFRKFDEKLTLTATFRTHNSIDAWLKNFYGLMRVQKTVSEAVNIEPGAITVISHSISIDPRRIDVAKSVSAKRSFEVNIDPCGNFAIQTENGEIVVRHFISGMQIDEYRGKNPVRIQHEIYRNCAVSDINHAIYIGRMLERAKICLETGEEFVQE